MFFAHWGIFDQTIGDVFLALKVEPLNYQHRVTLMTNYDQYWIGEASKLIQQVGLPVPTTPVPTVVSTEFLMYYELCTFS